MRKRLFFIAWLCPPVVDAPWKYEGDVERIKNMLNE